MTTDDKLPSSECVDYLKASSEFPPKPPTTILLMDEGMNCVELILDNGRRWYSEWIEGEGGDICLYRDTETKKVIGCCFPMYKKELRVIRIEKQ